MPTTKRRTNTSRRASQSRGQNSNSSSRSSTSRSSSASLASRTGKAIKNRPIATAALATGLVSGVAAAIAGFLAFKKSGKTFPEFRDDMTARVKDGLSEARTRAGEMARWRQDGLDEDRGQAEITEEALSLKETGNSGRKGMAGRSQPTDELDVAAETRKSKESNARSKGPRGPIAQQDIKTGMAAH